LTARGGVSIVHLEGRRLIAFIPGRLVRYLPRFEWEAAVATLGDEALEITDRVPQAGKSILNPKYARFP
jgi:hypothetical protein